MIFTRIILLLITLYAGCIMCSANCGCKYHAGGCTLYVAAPKGFKCFCSYVGAWTCKEAALTCQENEHCPGNLADFCACKLGGGNCGGYINPPQYCDASDNREIAVPANATCNCSYRSGGCLITKAAPFGWKCVCVYKGAWTCTGWPQQCSRNEICLGEDSSYCGCKQGGGNCGAYTQTSECPSHTISTCSCNKKRDWIKGKYDITGVTYNISQSKIGNLQLLALAEQFIPNNSSETQTVSFRAAEGVSVTSSFEHTTGLEIQVGTEFTASIPGIGDTTTSITVTTSYSHTYGESRSITKDFDQSFTCNGAPYSQTKCTVTVQKVHMAIPYTMNLTHKVIPNCICESHGVWTGTQAYNATLKAHVVGRFLKNGNYNIFSDKHGKSLQILMFLSLTLFNLTL